MQIPRIDDAVDAGCPGCGVMDCGRRRFAHGVAHVIAAAQRAPSSRASAVSAPAKVNWVLDLLDKRADGYHELETVGSTIDLADEVSTAERADGAGLTLTCTDGSLPTDERNLAHRAAMLLARRAGVPPDVSIHLNKRIPVGAGLGGGSSDAAAVLRALNRLWSLGWSAARLTPLAAAIGSDVPLLLHGGTAVARGRGEFVEPVRFAWPGRVTIAMPGLQVSTATVYASVRPGDLRIVASGVGAFGDAATTAKWTAIDLLRNCRNGLEPAAFRAFGRLAELQLELQRIVDRPWRLCGSGSSFFTVWDTVEEAARCARNVRETLGIRVETTRLEGTETANREDSQGGSDGHQ